MHRCQRRARRSLCQWACSHAHTRGHIRAPERPADLRRIVKGLRQHPQHRRVMLGPRPLRVVVIPDRAVARDDVRTMAVRSLVTFLEPDLGRSLEPAATAVRGVAVGNLSRGGAPSLSYRRRARGSAARLGSAFRGPFRSPTMIARSGAMAAIAACMVSSRGECSPRSMRA